MNRILRCLLICGLMVSSAYFATAQENFTISGYVKDKDSGETLIGANIFLENDQSTGTITNTYGFYSITLDSGQYRLVFSYLGFQDQVIGVNLTANQQLNVDLLSGIQMKEVVVEAKENEEDENVLSTSMGRVTLPIEQVKTTPSLLG